MGVEGKRMSVKDRKQGHLSGAFGAVRRRPGLLGVVVAEGDRRKPQRRPRMRPFIWGSKVAPPPTLPFGRWKSVA